jgi:uncharacterized iron-regulated membrane protein
MGIWIELGVFLLVFVFAAWQFHDLKREKQKRLARLAETAKQAETSGDERNSAAAQAAREDQPGRKDASG